MRKNRTLGPVQVQRGSEPEPDLKSAGCRSCARKSKLYAGSWSASHRFTWIASETSQKRVLAAISAIFVTACCPNCPSVLVQNLRCLGESAARPLHIGAIRWKHDFD